MANDNRPEIVLDGDVSPFRQKLREAANDLKRFGTEGEQSFERMTGPLKLLQERFVAIGALLAGGAVFKEAVAQTAKYTEESLKLGRALGISASEASILREALEAGNTSQDEFVGAAKGMAKQIRENEDVLQSMGLKTRDAAGHLRPLNELVLEGIDVVNGYRASTDRAIAGQAMFGKGFEMTSNLAEMNKKVVAEVAEQMQALGLVASVESVAAWQDFDDAGDKSALVMKGLKATIGNAVMPVLAQLGEWFASIGPAAVTVIRGAIGGLISLFHGFVLSINLIVDAFKAVWDVGSTAFTGLGELVDAVVQGRFYALPGIVSGTWDKMKTAVADRQQEMVDDAIKARDKIINLFADGTATAAPGKGGKGAGGLLKTDKDKQAKAAEEPSHMATYEAVLAERRNLYEQENALRRFSKEQELAYWRELQQGYELTSKDRLAIAKRTATLELEIRRESAKEQRALDQVMIDHHRGEVLARIRLEEQQAKFAQQNGEITKSQLVALEEDFARRRFEIEYQALLERLELAKSDPNMSPAELARIKEQLLDVEREYQLRKGELGQEKKQADGWGGLWDDAGAAFGNMADNLLTRATTLQQQLAGVFQSIYASFIQNLITKPLGEWIAAQARMLAQKMGFLAAEKGLETAASASTVGIKAAETTAVVAADAAQAGAGAAASQAAIPIVGPGLALAAMAAVFAAVMALGNRKSAARGFDIPKGLNPMTQLHEEEMVLPQKYGNVIRGLAAMYADGGQAGADGGGDGVHIHARSDADVVRVGQLKKLLGTMRRNFVDVRG